MVAHQARYGKCIYDLKPRILATAQISVSPYISYMCIQVHDMYVCVSKPLVTSLFHACVYVCIQDAGDFVPVKVSIHTLESLHRTEVLIKQWGAPIGNQYYKSVLPDVPLTLCDNCNKVYTLYNRCILWYSLI